MNLEPQYQEFNHFSIHVVIIGKWACLMGFSKFQAKIVNKKSNQIPNDVNWKNDKDGNYGHSMKLLKEFGAIYKLKHFIGV